MGCYPTFLKWMIFTFNFLFAICGLGILVVGVIVHLQITHFSQTLEANLVFPSVTLIVVGSIIFIISFFGCCGAIRESHCMTITFASFLLTILIIQVAVAVYAFIVLKNADNSEDVNIPENYKKFFNGYWSVNGNKEIVDALQSSFQCCGADSPDDFQKIGNGTIPWSCCGKPEGSVCSSGTDKIYRDGCSSKIKEVLVQAGTVLGGVALGIAGVELIGIIFALCLANSIKNTERRGYRV